LIIQFKWGDPLDKTEKLGKNQGPISQQVWHDKDRFLLKGPERQT
jgi:hypothetical protein